jgi:hypothetical protein
MTRKWIAINLIMLVGAGLLVWALIGSIRKFDTDNATNRMIPEKKKAIPDGGLASAPTPQKYGETEFAVIPNQNLFAESRKLDDKTESAAPPEAPPLDIKPVLKGVVIDGAQRMAMMIDPSTGNAGNVRPQVKLIGDSYRGFIILPLHDVSKRPAPGGKTPIIATRIVNFGSPGTAGAAGGIGVATAGAASNPAAGRQVSPPVTNQQAVGGVAGRGAPQRGQPGAQVIPGANQPLNWNQSIDTQGRVVINSPFGPIPVQPQPPATKK